MSEFQNKTKQIQLKKNLQPEFFNFLFIHGPSNNTSPELNPTATVLPMTEWANFSTPPNNPCPLSKYFTCDKTFDEDAPETIVTPSPVPNAIWPKSSWELMHRPRPDFPPTSSLSLLDEWAGARKSQKNRLPSLLPATTDCMVEMELPNTSLFCSCHK